MALKTARKLASYLFSRAATLRARPSTERARRRSFTNAVTRVILIWMVRGLFRTVAAMMAPCSVKA